MSLFDGISSIGQDIESGFNDLTNLSVDDLKKLGKKYLGISQIVNNRVVGGIVATVTIEESSDDVLEITKHPVQTGSSITDHAYLQPKKLKLSLGFNATRQKSISDIYKDILDLQEKREPFDVITGNRTYKNMLFVSIKNSSDYKTENSLFIEAELEEVKIVDVQSVQGVKVDNAKLKNASKNSKTKDAGSKETKDPKKEQISSALNDGKNLLSSGLGGLIK